jgi:predicted RNase H-like HicB family nuclease
LRVESPVGGLTFLISPGCVAVGETRDEVIRLIREAIVLHIDSLKMEGLPVLKSTSEGEFVDVEAA